MSKYLFNAVLNRNLVGPVDRLIFSPLYLQIMDGRDKKRRMSTEGESVNRDHEKQKTDGGQIVDINNPANSKEELKASDIVNISADEFKIVKTKLTFVDKSEGIFRFFNCGASGVQITAPRRFGKTTFMNMLKIFLMIEVDEDAKPISNPESSDNYKMFMNLKLGQNHGDFVKEHCGQYPVISMSFLFLGGKTKTQILDSLKKVICNTFHKHRYLLERAPDGSKNFKNKKIQGEIGKFLTYYDGDRLKELSEADVTDSLIFLSEILYNHFNKKVVILVDDVDWPIMNAITDNMEDETLKYRIHLLRDIFSAALKGNQFLERSLVSSCVRLSGVFSSEINNQYHARFLQEEDFSETFGFTRQELHDLLENDAFRVVKDFDGVKKWYNGYQILHKDEATIYNSWSIVNYVRNSIVNKKKMFDSYCSKPGWLNYLRKLFVNHELHLPIRRLVEGESISIVVAEPIVKNILELKRAISYPQNKLNQSQVDFFLQLLWDYGVLNAVEKNGNTVKLKIPNFEIKWELEQCYTTRHFEECYRLKSKNIHRYIKALEQLLEITISDEEESEIAESEEGTTDKCEEAMCNLVNAVSLLFSYDAKIPVDESELHHILYYLAYNNIHYSTRYRAVVKVSEELRDSDEVKGSYQSKRKEKRGNHMCVTLETAAVIFKFTFLKNDEAENSKSALQQIIENYFTLLDKEEYKHIGTKIYVGLCVKNNFNVSAHYLVNDTDLDNAKNVKCEM